MVASLKPYRRGSLRHDREMRFLTEWLEIVRRAVSIDVSLAIEFARLRKLPCTSKLSRSQPRRTRVARRFARKWKDDGVRWVIRHCRRDEAFRQSTMWAAGPVAIRSPVKR